MCKVFFSEGGSICAAFSPRRMFLVVRKGGVTGRCGEALVEGERAGCWKPWPAYVAFNNYVYSVNSSEPQSAKGPERASGQPSHFSDEANDT